jgi:pyruvate dehydrogenase E2 component (dihydrolipoamide acetyltransferase)
VLSKIALAIRRNDRNGHAAASSLALAPPFARSWAWLARSIGPAWPHRQIDVERAARETCGPEPSQRRGRTPPAKAPKAARTLKTRGLSDSQVLALYQPGSYEIVPHDMMRKIIAERLTLAKQTIPHFYLAIDCDLEALLAARTRLNGLAPREGPRAFKLSVNDFIIKAMAMALQSVPGANASWTEQGILRHRASDIAVAVALEGGGLFTPVIRDAEIKSLSEISNEMRDLAARARSKRLAPHEYQGGSTTISNLGMYGIDRFDAVINPPQASILAVGRGEKRAVVKDDALKIATMISVTLSVDHRVIDGALGAGCLPPSRLTSSPVTMLVRTTRMEPVLQDPLPEPTPLRSRAGRYRGRRPAGLHVERSLHPANPCSSLGASARPRWRQLLLEERRGRRGERRVAAGLVVTGSTILLRPRRPCRDPPIVQPWSSSRRGRPAPGMSTCSRHSPSFADWASARRSSK